MIPARTGGGDVPLTRSRSDAPNASDVAVRRGGTTTTSSSSEDDATLNARLSSRGLTAIATRVREDTTGGA